MNEITKELLDALKGAVAQMNLAAECVERGRHDEAILHLRSLTRGRSEAIAKAEAILAAPQPADDGWIPWAGGKCPVPNGTVVDVKYRDEYVGRGLPANESVDAAEDDAGPAYWRADGMSNDIIAYRVVKP